ncbi:MULTISPECIES: hypothetical protein [unclassified Crossiella]|uniref:hypothetical protein n=1 Tax=unclassified Crossiella TaxID=2620835 RepID=UPI0020000441|nr:MULTISPECIES: hypothetical protein [unclassified Crossiella]MCK2242813.1 hypothetical protein [Crossiella sp. S99.2]MCK2256690.1 hypothetical protein [Crossiella sp. S99.1]
MTSNDRLFQLLPGVYRRRDAERGGQLRALLDVITEQADLLDADLDLLYRNWFIETSQEWAVPYLGDLVGYQPLRSPGEELPPERAAALLAALAPRRDVADTIRNRRRKGNLALLEQLAADVADWPARAVQFSALLHGSTPVRLYTVDERANRGRRRRGRLADLRHGDALDRHGNDPAVRAAGLPGPFDTLSHTVRVSRPDSRYRRGGPNIPDVGLFVWRLRPYPVTKAPAYCIERAYHHYTFSILGNDLPLIAKPVPEPSGTHIAEEENVPAFIRRRAFAERLADYYGPGKSLCVYRDSPDNPVPLADVVAADLSGWKYRPQRGQVAIDPVLGRIAFASRGAPESGVWVTYHHGFSADLGGGEYHRGITKPPKEIKRYPVGPGGAERIMDAVGQWQQERATHPRAIIEITDNGAYQEQIDIPLLPGERLTIRAAEGRRPVVRLLDWYSNRPDALRIVGTAPMADADGCCPPPPEFTVDGLLITGRSVRISGPMGPVRFRHCTLVPGWSLDEHCRPAFEEEPSLELIDTTAELHLDHCIVGTIRVSQSETRTEPLRIHSTDSVIDATSSTVDAVTGPDCRPAHAVFSAVRSTVIGRTRVHQLGLVENSILLGETCVDRLAEGCLRFSWIEPGARTPRRHQCQPDVALADNPPEADLVTARIRPRFTSLRYGEPGYAQLALDCAEATRRCADDAGEPGVFHDLFQPQRQDNLRTRINEHLPAGCEAGIILVS